MQNFAGHLSGVKSSAVKARQRELFVPATPNAMTNLHPPVAVFAAVDQGLSDRVAKAIGVPTVAPLKVKPASEATRFHPNLAANAN